ERAPPPDDLRDQQQASSPATYLQGKPKPGPERRTKEIVPPSSRVPSGPGPAFARRRNRTAPLPAPKRIKSFPPPAPTRPVAFPTLLARPTSDPARSIESCRFDHELCAQPRRGQHLRVPRPRPVPA